MKKSILFLILMITLLMLLPITAAAEAHAEEQQMNTPAYFTPNLPPDNRGLILFYRPAYSATQHSGSYGANSWWIAPNEKVRVNHLRDNGWAEVTVTNPTGVEQDGYILMRMLVPVENDENAVALFAQFERRVDWEHQTIKWGLILVTFGLIISFMTFLRIIRTVLLTLSVFASSAIIVYFLWNTDGFTYILPSVYGWKWAAIWFACFTLFFIAQVFLFIRTLNCVQQESGTFAIGMNLIVVICVVIFYAIYLLAGIFADLFWKPLTVPFEWVDANFNWVFLGIQALCVIIFISNSESKVKTIIITPLYIVGFAAIALMFRGMILGYIVALGAFLVLSALANSESDTTPLTSSERAEREEKARRDRHFAAYGHGWTHTHKPRKDLWWLK